MRCKAILIVVAAIVALMASSASVSAVPCAGNPSSDLNTFVTTQCSLTLGSLTFTGNPPLSYTHGGTFTPPDASGIQVTAANINPPGLPGIRLSGGLSVGANSFIDLSFGYIVTTTGAPITDIHLAFQGVFTGTGSVNVTEQVLDAAGHVLGTLFVQNPPPIFTADIVLSSPQTQVFITKDIRLSGGTDGTANLSIIDQLVSVPEPATLLLLGSGLIGMALGQRRSRRK